MPTPVEITPDPSPTPNKGIARSEPIPLVNSPKLEIEHPVETIVQAVLT